MKITTNGNMGEDESLGDIMRRGGTIHIRRDKGKSLQEEMAEFDRWAISKMSPEAAALYLAEAGRRDEARAARRARKN